MIFIFHTGLSNITCGKIDVWQLFPLIVMCSLWDIKSTIILDVTQQPVKVSGSFSKLVPRLTQPPYISLICNTLPTTPLSLRWCPSRSFPEGCQRALTMHFLPARHWLRESHVKIIGLLYQISVRGTGSCASTPPAGTPTTCKCVCLLLCQCVFVFVPV